MNAGRLDRRITLQRPARVRGEDGSWVDTWEDVATVWATVADLTAKERVGAPQVFSALAARMTIRYREDVRPEWRIVYEGRPWRISGIREFGRREGVEIFAEQTEGP